MNAASGEGVHLADDASAPRDRRPGGPDVDADVWDDTGAAECAPGWFDLTVAVAATGMAATGVIGVALGLVGAYRTWIVLPAALVVTVLAGVLARRALVPLRAGRNRTVAAALALGLAAVVTVGVAALPSQSTVVVRDPGSYLNTALWLAEDGSLEVDTADDVFGSIRDVRRDSAAVWELDDGRLQFQFNHLASAVMAAGYDLGGHRLVFRIPALALGLGLLGVYSVAVRVTRRPFLSLTAPALLAVTAPVLFVGRDTYSEPFTFALLWAAVLLGATLHRRPRAGVGAILGLLVGALVAVRVDALLYIGLAAPLVALSVAAPGGRSERRSRAAAWGATLVTGLAAGSIGWIDLVTRSGEYAQDLAPLLSELRTAMLASLGVSVAVAVVLIASPAVRTAAARISTPVAGFAAVAVLAVLLAGWLLRPELQTLTTRTPFTTVAELQDRNGLVADRDRTYHEESLRWMSWYLGVPGLVAAMLGYAGATWRAVRGRTDPWTLATLAIGLGTGALYWWRPSITPDQLWAMRRYVPSVLPALAIMATLASSWLLAWLGRGLGPRLRSTSVGHRVLAAVVVVALILPAVATTWPIRAMRSQAGYVHPVLEACDTVGADGAILVLGNLATLTLPQTLRSWCGVPVAAQGDALGRELPQQSVEAIATEVAEGGRQLFLVALDLDQVASFDEAGGPDPVSTTSVEDRWSIRPTLERPPDELRGRDGESVVPSPFQLHLLEVEPG